MAIINISFGSRDDKIQGTPKDLDAARDLARRDKYQFQWWAVSLVEAQALLEQITQYGARPREHQRCANKPAQGKRGTSAALGLRTMKTKSPEGA